MNKTTQFTIGSEVSCKDGTAGELRRVVIDPVARALTHLVVEPKDGSEPGRLVPVDLVGSAGETVVLTCTTSEFEKLDQAEETEFIPGGNGLFGYDQDQVLSWPYFGLAGGTVAAGGLGSAAFAGAGTQGGSGYVVTNDRVPEGDVLVRRNEHVYATDGAIGKVKGLVIQPGDHRVTHVLLDEGHLWGQKRVAIPINAVKDVGDGVQLNLTKDEVRVLPPVQVDDD